MNALVIYDSVFGNTEKIAHSIAATLDTSDQLITPIAVNCSSKNCVQHHKLYAPIYRV